MSNHYFYFASSPFHFFLSSAIAISNPDQKHILLLIDQYSIEDNPYKELLETWTESPFSDFYFSAGHQKSWLKKRDSRKKIFQDIKSLIKKFNPNKLFTGSDKRLEFQYAAHIQDKARCIYLDEGTYSYIAPSWHQQLSHLLFDTIIKKVLYGNWYKSTPFTAGSAYIDEVMLAFPEQAHEQLKKKLISPLPSSLFEQPAMRSLANLFLKNQQLDMQTIRQWKYVIILPHESILEDIAIKSSWISLIQTLCKSSSSIAVKYHPRDLQKDRLNLAHLKQIQLIPQKLVFESMLVGLNQDTVIIGDFSTALLTMKWLRPESTVLAIMEKVNKNRQFIKFYEHCGIKIKNLEEVNSIIFPQVQHQ